MREYFCVLLITSVCGGMCAVLAQGGFEKYIKYISSLVCVCVMIIPFARVDFQKISDEIEGLENEISYPEQENLYSLSARMTEARTEEYISEIVFSKFGIMPSYCHIEIDWGASEPVITNITVALSGEDASESDKVRDYLCNSLGGEISVIEG